MMRGRYRGHLSVRQVFENRPRESRSLFGVRAGAEFVQQYERFGSRRAENLDDIAHVRAECGHGLFDALLVAHIGIHAVESRQNAAIVRRYLQARLVHQREQPDRLHRYRLAARVRSRNHEHRPVGANAHIDRHDIPAQHRMPRVDEPHAHIDCRLLFAVRVIIGVCIARREFGGRQRANAANAVTITRARQYQVEARR